jgi:hypothetical protein
MFRLRSLLFGLSLLLFACGSTPDVLADDGSWAASQRGRATAERAMSRGRARDVLGQLEPQSRALLDELMFLADLQMASGNENNPLRIYRRVQRELAEPQVVSPQAVAMVLSDMARVLEDHPGVPEGEYDSNGYDVVTTMLASAQGAFPSAGTCLDRIASMPDQVAVAFLVQEWFADDHYHDYWMKEQIFELLVTGGYGPLPLVVVEDRLRDSWPSHSPDSEWARSVAVGRAIVGDDFEAWYKEIRGSSYTWEWITSIW